MFATRLAVAAAFLATAVVATVAHADGPPGACECGVTPAPSAAPAAAPASTPSKPGDTSGLRNTA